MSVRTIVTWLAAVALATPGLALGASKDYKGKDLSGKELTNENFDRADLSDANLQSANLKNATLKGANLKRADLSSARLDTADFTEADLRGATLKKASLDSTKFVKANLEGGEIFFAYGNPFDEEGSKKARRVLEDAGVRTEDVSAIMSERNGDLTLKQANLKNAKLHGQLDGIDFRRADLRGADLHNTKNPEKANFRGAIYDSATRWPPKFEHEKSGAVKESDAVASATTKPGAGGAMTWTGKWMIKPEKNGATEDGILTINKDGTYTWDYSVKANPVEGKWKEGGDGIILRKGESGYDWVVSKAQEHPERPDSIELKAADAQLRRWAVPIQ